MGALCGESQIYYVLGISRVSASCSLSRSWSLNKRRMKRRGNRPQSQSKCLLGISPRRLSLLKGYSAHSKEASRISFPSTLNESLHVNFSPTEVGTSPWGGSSKAQDLPQPPIHSCPSFSKILEDEQQKHENLQRALNKPLHLIQVRIVFFAHLCF